MKLIISVMMAFKVMRVDKINVKKNGRWKVGKTFLDLALFTGIYLSVIIKRVWKGDWEGIRQTDKMCNSMKQRKNKFQELGNGHLYMMLLGRLSKWRTIIVPREGTMYRRQCWWRGRCWFWHFYFATNFRSLKC